MQCLISCFVLWLFIHLLYVQHKGKLNSEKLNKNKNRKETFLGFTCWLDWPIVSLDTVDLIGLSDVQLVAFRDLLEVCALVERTAETCLPHGGVSFILPLPVFALVNSPGLNVNYCNVRCLFINK